MTKNMTKLIMFSLLSLVSLIAIAIDGVTLLWIWNLLIPKVFGAVYTITMSMAIVIAFVASYIKEKDSRVEDEVIAAETVNDCWLIIGTVIIYALSRSFVYLILAIIIWFMI